MTLDILLLEETFFGIDTLESHLSHEVFGLGAAFVAITLRLGVTIISGFLVIVVVISVPRIFLDINFLHMFADRVFKLLIRD